MQVKKLLNNTYIIRMEPGEALVANLEKFTIDKQIGFSEVRIIGGGFKNITYSFSVGHDVGYITEKVTGGDQNLGLELISAIGCIAWDYNDQSKPAVHLHASFIDRNLKQSFGGHLVEVENVSLTAEIFLTVLTEEKICRKLDTRVKVPLLDLPAYKKNKLGNK